MDAATEDTPKGLARVRDAQQYLSVSRQTVYSLMEKGELRYVKLGKTRRIPWQALEELVSRNTIGQ